MAQDIKSELKNYKRGTFIKFEWFSKPSQKKEYKDRVKKVSYGVYRLGVDYSNIEEVKLMDASVEQPQHHLQGQQAFSTPYFIILNEKTQKEKLRVYTTKNHKHRTITKYYLDDKEVSKQELLDLGAIRDTPHKDLLCFDVFLDNIIKLG